MKPFFVCFIPGRPGIKKNSKRIFKGRVFSSERYLAWEKQAEVYVRQAMVNLGVTEAYSGPVQMKALFHFKNKRSEPDLSNLYEGIQDLLQKMGVLKDDKLIQSHDGSRKIFGETEGLYVELWPMVD